MYLAVKVVVGISLVGPKAQREVWRMVMSRRDRIRRSGRIPTSIVVLHM